MAALLGLPVYKLKTELPYIEYRKWLAFLAHKHKKTQKWEHYAAEIIKKLDMFHYKDIAKIPVSDYIYEYITKEEQEKKASQPKKSNQAMRVLLTSWASMNNIKVKKDGGSNSKNNTNQATA